MYQLNEFDLRRQRRHELLREAESDRLARRLGSLRPKEIGRARSTLADGLGRQHLDAPTGLCGEKC
jgi:hypothetical protein